jgi:CysZ protein
MDVRCQAMSDELMRSTGSALVAADEALHPMLRAVLGAYDGERDVRFKAGLRLSAASVRFLVGRPALWPAVALPILINLGLFAGALVALWLHGGALLDMIWAHPLEGEGPLYALLMGGWYVFRFLGAIVGVVASYALVMVVGGVVASPFHDYLSERTERDLLGARYAARPQSEWWRSIGASLISSALTAGLYIAVMIPLFMLNIIPAVGSLTYTVLGGAASSFFLGLEYSDGALARRGWPWSKKIRVFWEERSLTLGFGLGTSIMMAVPLLNLFVAPIAVIGGTALAITLDERRVEPPQNG